jgi:hypothetical protein
MTRARLGALVISLLAITGLGLGLAQSAHAAPEDTSVRMVVFDCPGQPAQIKPRTFIVTCADGGIQFDKLSWTSWTPSVASAAGTLEENDCTPTCVAGHFHAYPALLILWGSKPVPNHPGERCYTMMTSILTGARPRYYDYAKHKWVTAPVTQTSPLLTAAAAAVSPGA